MFKRVEVAVDMSAPSRSAVEAAARLARLWGAGLELLHVEDAPAWSESSLAPRIGSYSWPWADYHRWRKENLKRWLGRFPAARVRVHSVAGWPPDMLAELSRRSVGRLLVMGTHGYAGLDRALFGSVAEAVVRRAKSQVLVVPEGGWKRRPRLVLAPWNGRPYATGALRAAAGWAKSLGARLAVLIVLAPWETKEGAEPALRRRLDRLLAGFPRAALRVRHGDARETIMHESEGCDLLVLAAHRRPFTSDFMIGSTVERALRHGRVPVLSVPSTGGRKRSLALPPSAWIRGGSYIF
ncbi:MAG: universal stress protein [Elusimicrobiota bacterium]